HASNEINVLSKLILMMRKDEPAIKLIDHVEAGQVFIIMRVLIGKLHEAWRLFQTRVRAHPRPPKKYETKAPAEGDPDTTEGNRHFGKGSQLTKIRSAVSFHYTDDDNLAEASFQRLPETEPWEFYLSRTVGNSFYFASELVIGGSVIGLAMAQPHGGAAPTDL